MLAFAGLGRIDHAKPAFCILVSSSFLCAVVNSVTLSLMAIDRDDCVLRPFNRRMTPSNMKFIIAGKWIGAVLFIFDDFVLHLALDPFFANCQT